MQKGLLRLKSELEEATKGFKNKTVSKKVLEIALKDYINTKNSYNKSMMKYGIINKELNFKEELKLIQES